MQTKTRHSANRLTAASVLVAGSLLFAGTALAEGPGDHDHWHDRGHPEHGYPSYRFDRRVVVNMRHHYRGEFVHVDRRHRPVFRVGVAFPPAYIGRIRPVPPSLLVGVAPPPPGYAMGYIDGYAVVYNPVTRVVIDFNDLL